MAYWIQADDADFRAAVRRQPTHLPGMLTRAEMVAYYAARAGPSTTELALLRGVRAVPARRDRPADLLPLPPGADPQRGLRPASCRWSGCWRARAPGWWPRIPAGPPDERRAAGAARAGQLRLGRLRPALRPGPRAVRGAGRSLAARGCGPTSSYAAPCGATASRRRGAVPRLVGTVDVEQDAGWDEFDHLSGPPEPPGSRGGRGRDPRGAGGALRGGLRAAGPTGGHDAEYAEACPPSGSGSTLALDRLVEHARRAPDRASCSPPAGRSPGWRRAAAAGPGGLATAGGRGRQHLRDQAAHGPRGQRLVTFNDHAHLEPAARGLLTYR